MSNDILTLDEYKKRFHGFGVRDCAVAKRDIYFFVVLQDWDDSTPRPFEEELKTRLIKLHIGGEPTWIMSNLDGFGGLMCSGPISNSSLGVCVDRTGQVFAKHSEGGEIEEKIPGGKGGGTQARWCKTNQADQWLALWFGWFS
jgi:hypothetical protein